MRYAGEDIIAVEERWRDIDEKKKNSHSLMQDRKKWRPRRHSPNQLRNTGKLRKRGKRGGIGGTREGRGRNELTASWKKISRAGAIGAQKR